ncbi:hypothetical protein AWB74_04960 [Caballeronia arvi]|uniref:Uncharacterized protein n=1 Tax=Caballeronia arvi TaxID=1777135 RepID=A0A158K536_9BURK|nr:hypothetical protein [Caballeronia arvi]SAL76222.1 hypothetical protein AWB74_04960 [Caballeronia arvi]
MEFEVSKLLVKHGFFARADFTYTRHGAESKNDFSVDLEAVSYLPFRNRVATMASLHLLVECKHRHRNNKWLFFPDPNVDKFWQITFGRTLRVVDDFSPVMLNDKYSVAFDESLIFCIKGVEVDIASAKVYDSEIKHGLSQLQYALPRLVSECIEFNLDLSPHHSYPFMFCPILLTTSDIFVASSDTTINTVEHAENIDDFASPVPWLVMLFDRSPEFHRHRSVAFQNLIRFLRKDLPLSRLDDIRRKTSVHERFLPSHLCDDSIRDTANGAINSHFGRTIVCSLANFEALLIKLKALASWTSRARIPLLDPNSPISEAGMRL